MARLTTCLPVFSYLATFRLSPARLRQPDILCAQLRWTLETGLLQPGAAGAWSLEPRLEQQSRMHRGDTGRRGGPQTALGVSAVAQSTC